MIFGRSAGNVPMKSHMPVNKEEGRQFLSAIAIKSASNVSKKPLSIIMAWDNILSFIITSVITAIQGKLLHKVLKHLNGLALALSLERLQDEF